MILIDRLKRLNKTMENKKKSTFKFDDLINRYSQGEVMSIYYEKELVPPGNWIEKEKKELLETAAIVSLSNDDLQTDTGGLFNHDTRKLYCYKLLKKGDKIINIMNNEEKRTYTILQHEDKSDYAEGLHIYYLNRSDLE